MGVGEASVSLRFSNRNEWSGCHINLLTQSKSTSHETATLDWGNRLLEPHCPSDTVPQSRLAMTAQNAF
jgi:hypothetical protein